MRETAASFDIPTWSAKYNDRNEHLYEHNIGRPLCEITVLQLFVWKNTMKLSAKKEISVQNNFISRIYEVRLLPVDYTADEFLQRFRDGGVIWRIFWLHCWQPVRFPVFDQHVYRAMTYLQTRSACEIPTQPASVIHSYIEDYIPFFMAFPRYDNRRVDKALFAYGKSLKKPLHSTRCHANQ